MAWPAEYEGGEYASSKTRRARRKGEREKGTTREKKRRFFFLLLLPSAAPGSLPADPSIFGDVLFTSLPSNFRAGRREDKRQEDMNLVRPEGPEEREKGRSQDGEEKEKN